MEQLKEMKKALEGVVQGQMAHLDCVDTEELGEAVDMIKDLAEAIYYCTITKAMEERDKEEELEEKIMMKHKLMGGQGEQTMYYTEPRFRPPERWYDPERDMDRERNRVYYTEPGRNGNNSTYMADGGRDGNRTSMETGRNANEGRSPQSRRTYMENKKLHTDKNVQMQELERYMQELATDITEMIHDASPEEKTLLHKKLTALANRVGN